MYLNRDSLNGRKSVEIVRQVLHHSSSIQANVARGCTEVEIEIRTMEELLASLSREVSGLETPIWHENVLKETAARYGAGQEQPLDWAEAKRQLRNRAAQK
jgi:hypothetical protein